MEVQEKEEEVPYVNSFTGLPNDKHYQCYMNSVLQCLLATPQFKHAFQEAQENPKSRFKGAILACFKRFLGEYEDTNVVDSINDLQIEMGKEFEQFSTNQQ